MFVAFARYWRILLNRKELESLSFLFMPQATVHQVTNPFKDLDWLEGSAEQGKHGRGNGRDGPHSRKTVHEPSTWEDLNATRWASWPPSARSHVASFSRDWCSSICEASAGHAHHEDYTGDDPTPCYSVEPFQNFWTNQESGTMGDYHSWLDNIAAADMRASKYFVDKVQILYTVDHARN